MKTPLLILLLAAALLFSLAPVLRADLSEAQARDYLQKGARVVDVRTVSEFATRHLTNAVNIPLDEVKVKFPTVVTNKAEVVLLHCQSGRRSGAAEKELRQLGYTNVFNIGSFEQARKIVEGAKK